MKIHFTGSAKSAAQHTVQQFIERYGQNDLASAAYVVTIGGDGTALNALCSVMATPATAVFAMRLPGSVGALANVLSLTDLPERLTSAKPVTLRPLKAEIERLNGDVTATFGFNEIVVSRMRLQLAKLTVHVADTDHFQSIAGDGLMVVTPIGSKGYNRSAGGSTLQLDSGSLLLTGIAVRAPTDWTNAVLSDRVVFEIEVVDPSFHPVRVETSSQEVLGISRLKISLSPQHAALLLLEPQLADAESNAAPI
jgi:NAD+ kinase